MRLRKSALNESDVGEYYRESGLTDAQAKQLLLDDTVLPDGLMAEEEREACRALKGSMLRQEIYALDGTEEEKHPYTVAEQNFTIRRLQPQAGNRHAVFFTHAREAISYHYERDPADPRLSHALTIEVDDFGNVLKSAAVGYGRRQPDMTLPAEDRAKQTEIHITYTENGVTNSIEATDDYRTPLPCESRTYELTGLTLPAGQSRLTLAEILTAGTGAAPIGYEQSPTPGALQKRLIEHARTLYRPDDLGVAQNDPLALLPWGTAERLALPGESYKLAFTPGLLNQIYVRSDQKLLPANPADVLEGGGADGGGYVDLDGDANWWIPSGRIFFSPEDSLARLMLYPEAAVQRIRRATVLFTKTLQLIQGLGLSEREVRHLLTHATDFDNLDLSKLPAGEGDDSLAAATTLFGQFLRLSDYARLKRDVAGGTDDLIGVFENARRSYPATADANQTKTALFDELCQRLADITRRDVAAVRAAAQHLGFAARSNVAGNELRVEVPDFSQEKGIWRLWEVLQVAERLGVPIEAIARSTEILSGTKTPEERFGIARDLRNTVKARYEPENWQRIAQPIFDKLRQRS